MLSALIHMLRHSGEAPRTGLDGLIVGVLVVLNLVLNLVSCLCHLVVNPLWMVFGGVTRENRRDNGCLPRE